MIWIIAIAVLAFIVLSIFAHVDIKRRTGKLQRIKGDAERIIRNTYPELTANIISRYPNIPFSFDSLEVCLEHVQDFFERFVDVYTTNSYSGLTPERLARDALSMLIDQAASAYESKSISLKANHQIPYHLGAKTFWENEAKYRATQDGQLPGDWQARRAIVLERDAWRCTRCGLRVTAKNSHVHHIIMRSRGGDHSFENLVTLCKSCHALMDEHERLKANFPSFISSNGVIHTRKCHYRFRSTKVWESVPHLVSKGYRLCERCRPFDQFRSDVYRWNPGISKWLYSRMTYLVRRNSKRSHQTAPS